jgi:SET domain-containing protein
MSQITRIGEIPNKGRGLIANVDIQESELIEESSIIIFSKAAAKSCEIINYTYPYDYTYEGRYDPGVDSVCIALGNSTLINCSADSNTTWEIDPVNKLFRLFAKRFIAADEEITLYYGLTEEQMLERGWTT